LCKEEKSDGGEHKNEFFACEICKILIKNHLVHEKSEYHQKNLNNGWKDEKDKKKKERKMAEHFPTKIIRMEEIIRSLAK
jgi:hypothetical protein